MLDRWVVYLEEADKRPDTGSPKQITRQSSASAPSARPVAGTARVEKPSRTKPAATPIKDDDLPW
jgi:hypothetical protein